MIFERSLRKRNAGSSNGSVHLLSNVTGLIELVTPGAVLENQWRRNPL